MEEKEKYSLQEIKMNIEKKEEQAKLDLKKERKRAEQEEIN